MLRTAFKVCGTNLNDSALAGRRVIHTELLSEGITVTIRSCRKSSPCMAAYPLLSRLKAEDRENHGAYQADGLVREWILFVA